MSAIVVELLVSIGNFIKDPPVVYNSLLTGNKRFESLITQFLDGLKTKGILFRRSPSGIPIVSSNDCFLYIQRFREVFLNDVSLRLDHSLERITSLLDDYFPQLSLSPSVGDCPEKNTE